MLRVSLLGEFSITYNSVPIKDLNTPRLQSLLAHLILHRDAPQSRSHIAFLFWPDTNETQARTNLRYLLHQLRHALPEANTYLDIIAQTLQWRSESDFSLDLDDFWDALTQGENATYQLDLSSQQEALEKAVALYRGDLLPDCYDDWIMPFREECHQAYLNALERLIALLEEKHAFTSAIYYAQRLLQQDPLHERTYQSLIRLHALNRDRTGALRVYHVCETVLGRELGVKPNLATREAYESLLGEEGKTVTSPASIAFFPLVGREEECTQLKLAWRAVRSNQGSRIILLSGEAGIGKTRLLEEMSQWATHQGITTANAQCYAAEGQLAYSPVTTWLRAQPLGLLEDLWLVETSRLLPEIHSEKPNLPRPGPLTEEWQRKRLFEALARAILGLNQPLLLTIDDLQWCDRDTLEWIHFLLRFDRSERLLILGAYRPEEIETGHPLDTLRAALRAEGWITEINLSPLDMHATQILATLISGIEIDQETSQILYQQTEGNPLFVVETVRVGLPPEVKVFEYDQTFNHAVDAKYKAGDLPAKVQAVLTARLAQLSPEAQTLAGLAAAIGREFRISLLEKASGLDQDSLVNQLDELWQRRIIREQGLDAYDFSHEKLREVAFQNMSRGRRRLVHRQVAEALEVIHASDLAPVSRQLATHYEGAGIPERAVPYYLLAAQMARKVYANQEAKLLLERGLAITESMKGGEGQRGELVEQLWEGLGDLLVLSANHEEALIAFRNAKNRLLSSEKINQARITRKMAQTLTEERRYAETLEACEQAEAILGMQPAEDIRQWWDEWIDVQIEKVWAYYWTAQWQAMETLVERINLVVKVRASGVTRMRFLMASCLMNLRKYRYVVSDEMLVNSQESLAISRAYGSLQNQVDCSFELGFLHLWQRELERVEEHLQHSLTLAENTGNLLFQTLNLTYLTVLFRFQGQARGVMDYARRAEQVAQTAHMPDYIAAAKANLAWLAWRGGDHHKAEVYAREALTIWGESPLVYPFQWQALWPLIGVMLKQNKQEEAWSFAQALLEPTQQRLPQALNDLLENALVGDDEGKRHLNLDQAATLAHELGYL